MTLSQLRTVNHRQLLASCCLVAAFLGVVAVGSAVPMVESDSGGPSDTTTGADEPFNVTYNKTYEATFTVATSGPRHGYEYERTYWMDLDAAVATTEGEIALAGAMGQWNPAVDRSHDQALLLQTHVNGTRTSYHRYGGSIVGANRSLGCDIQRNPSYFDAPEPPLSQYEQFDPADLIMETMGCGVVSQNPRNPSNSEDDLRQRLRDNYDEWGRALTATDSGGFVLAGATDTYPRTDSVFGPATDRGTPWLVNVDENGNEVWNRTYNTGGRFAEVIQTDDGGYLAVGSSYPDGKQEDLWLLKVDTNGAVQWSKSFGGVEDDRGHDVIETSRGNYAVAGETYSYTLRGDASYNNAWLLTVDENGNALTNRSYTGVGKYGDRAFEAAYAVIEHSDGGFALAGDTNAFADDNQDAWLIRTDQNGDMRWNRTYGASDQYGTREDELARYLVESPSGGFMIAAQAAADPITGEQSIATWLVKTHANGTTQWSETIRAGRINRPESLVKTSDNTYAAVIEQTGTSVERRSFRSRVIKFTDEMAVSASATDDQTPAGTPSVGTPVDGSPPGNTPDSKTPSGESPSDETKMTDTEATETAGSNGPGFGALTAILAVILGTLVAKMEST